MKNARINEPVFIWFSKKGKKKSPGVFDIGGFWLIKNPNFREIARDYF